jgi:putative FmdB family regulatory protein
MPTYEYECKSCGHTFDVFQNMSDEPVKVCPACGSEVRRLINGGTGVIFKGSGFYVTDKNKSSGGASSAVKKDNKAPAAADAPAGAGTGKPGSGVDAGKSTEAPKPKAETSKT